MKKTLIILTMVLGLVSCKKPDPVGPVGPVAEVTVRGCVKGNDGTPLEGVVVSDGLVCVKTGTDGRYELPADLDKARMVMVSTPATHSAPVVKGIPVFHKWLKDCKKGPDGKYSGVDFTLEKIAGNPQRYTVFMSADPQPRNRTAGYDKFAFHSLDCCEDLYRDWRETSAKITDRPVYGVVLGDIVHENMTLFKPYCEALAKNGYPTFNVIGNHDHDLDSEGSTGGQNMIGKMTFEKNFGPANYSFNLGNQHWVVMDDMYVPYKDGKCPKGNFVTGFTDDDWEWLRNDLGMVDRSKTVMFCAHGVMMMTPSGKDTGLDHTFHRSDVAHLLGKYAKTHTWFGHGHITFNYVYPADHQYFPNCEVHMLHRSTGRLWTNETEASGTPRGYIIIDVNGDEISWKLKPVPYQSSDVVSGAADMDRSCCNYTFTDGVATWEGKPLDSDYQIAVYAPGCYNGSKYVFANVFMWDSKWSKPTWTPDGGKAVTMNQQATSNTYDWFEKVESAYYNKKYPSQLSETDYTYHDNLKTIFNAYCTDDVHGGTVSVTDRFGNTYSTHITW